RVSGRFRYGFQRPEPPASGHVTADQLQPAIVRDLPEPVHVFQYASRFLDRRVRLIAAAGRPPFHPDHCPVEFQVRLTGDPAPRVLSECVQVASPPPAGRVAECVVEGGDECGNVRHGCPQGGPAGGRLSLETTTGRPRPLRPTAWPGDRLP